MDLDILAGRLLAFCLRPRTAWPRLSPGERAAVAAAYGTFSYVVVLFLLLAGCR